MIKIILVDNDERNYLALKNIISKLDFLYNKNLVLEWYQTYNQILAKAINNVEIKKIYLVNIQYSFKNYSLASIIRQKDYHSELILLGNKYNNWIKNLFDFIPNIYQNCQKIYYDLKEILDKGYIGNMFHYHNRKLNINIYYDNILYIYRDTNERKTIIVTDNNNYPLGMSLNEVKYLLDNRFKQVHRACLLNMCRVQEYNWAKSYFTLDNGNKINLLSKKYRPTIEINVF